MAGETLEIRPVEPDMWPEFEQLFEARGGPKSCWCMVWRDFQRNATAKDQADRKRGMQDRIERGQKVGLMGFLGREPVAWCSVAPRPTFKASLDGLSQAEGSEKWSLTCLFVKRAHRGKGLSGTLIDAAVDYARAQGASALDAYPVDPESPSYRFCGFVSQFDSRGFAAVGSVGTRRHLFTRRL